jgi:transposase
MEHYAGIDVALEQSSVCVVDGSGRIVREARVASEPEALTRFLGRLGLVVTRIGIEAGPLSQWLHAGLTKAGLEVVLLETRQVKAAQSAMVVKTDRKDARGIAQLLRMGWFRPVPCKSLRPTSSARTSCSRGDLQCTGRSTVLFTRAGFEEMDEAGGLGSPELEDDGSLDVLCRSGPRPILP